jgi:hypothetical protein
MTGSLGKQVKSTTTIASDHQPEQNRNCGDLEHLSGPIKVALDYAKAMLFESVRQNGSLGGRARKKQPAARRGTDATAAALSQFAEMGQ